MEEGHAELGDLSAEESSRLSAILHPPLSPPCIAPPIFSVADGAAAAAAAATEAEDSSIAPWPSMTDRRPAERNTQQRQRDMKRRYDVPPVVK